MIEHHLDHISSRFVMQTELMRFWLGHTIEVVTTIRAPLLEKRYKEDHMIGMFMYPVCFVIDGIHYAFYNRGNDSSYITIAVDTQHRTDPQWQTLMFGEASLVDHNLLAPMRQVVGQPLEDIQVVCVGDGAIGLAFVTQRHQLWLVNPGAYHNTIIDFQSPFVLSTHDHTNRNQETYPIARSVDV